MKPSPSSRHHLLCRLLAFVAIVNPTFFSVCVSSAGPTPARAPDLQAAAISRTITVDMAGGGNFTSIQAAIDAVPVGNTRWVRILVKRGTYREKVEIPQSRPYIVMEGEGTHLTVVRWGDYVVGNNNNTSHARVDVVSAGGNPVQLTSRTGTFTLRADNFVAKLITFENTYGKVPGNPQTQALAAMVEGDKAAFYNCSFIGFQDTLCDNRGRHYFRDCYIEGFVDFIFGSGQSIYEGCKIWVVGSSKPYGYITAHGRSDPRSPSGFVFKQCAVDGERLAFLGRAWGTYPLVLFYRTYMAAEAVHPLRWDPFGKQDQVGSMTFAEKDCHGPGSDRPGRVKWAKNLTNREIRRYTSMSFVDGEGWLQRQPDGAAAAAA